jgi:PST family polysaccharide transporter
LFFGANLLINIFYTPDFQPAVLVIKILSIAPISLFLINTYGVNYLVLAGKERVYRNIILVASVIGFITTWILTPKYGYIGTAITISGIWFLRGIATFICAYLVQNQQNK